MQYVTCPRESKFSLVTKSSDQLHERRDSTDFDLKTQDKLTSPIAT
jgi:hypothetical protein